MKFRSAIAAILLFAIAVPAMVGQTEMAGFFINAPMSRFPLITKMKRMDMVDYYNGGVDKGSDNLLGGKSKVVLLTPDQISIELAEGGLSETTISLYAGKKDSVLIVTENVATPATDGTVKFYRTDWSEITTPGLFSSPEVADWFNPKASVDMTDIDILVPFVMAEYSYSPETKILTLTPTLKQYLPKDDYDKVAPALRPQLRYKWNGKKMSPMK